MPSINEDTPVEEVAALVSQALEAAGIEATLSGGGPLRIITPTQAIMDRVAAYVHWNDRQSWDQAMMVAERQDVDWSRLERWTAEEGVDNALIRHLRDAVRRGSE